MTRPAGLLAALALVGLAATPAAATQRPIVVELFTSQGCSSCPPADAALIDLIKRPNVLALSFSVTYWDRLGWKDVFGKPEFTDRQVAYETSLGERGPFTPQVVIEGRKSAVGSRRGEIDALLASTAPLDGPALDIAGDRLSIGAGAVPQGGAEIWLVRYEPGVLDVAVARGENAGRRLAHGHVVRDLVRLGDWRGEAVERALPAEKGGLRRAVLVQRPGGAILAAATD